MKLILSSTLSPYLGDNDGLMSVKTTFPSRFRSQCWEECWCSSPWSLRTYNSNEVHGSRSWYGGSYSSASWILWWAWSGLRLR